MEIKHNNIVYIRDFTEIGGVETFTYEIVKKYKDLDIAVVCKTIHPKQAERIKRYCKVYIHTNQRINCKVAIINYDTTIIDFITEKIWKENAGQNEGIYQVVHGDYEHSCYGGKVPQDPRVKEYIAVTKHIAETFKRLTGNENVICGYNPLTIEEEKPRLKLISATRLSKIKGVERMIRLAETLDYHNIDYIWYIFTNSPDIIRKPNVIFMRNRLDVGRWIAESDYLVQLSDTEACSYAINEALYRNIPVICTKLPYLQEIGVVDKKNGYLMDFDCGNIEEIVAKIQNKPKFEFKKLNDRYNKILAKGKSQYKEERMDKKVKVRATDAYMQNNIEDSERGYVPKPNEEFFISESRYKTLSVAENNSYGLVFVRLVEQPKVETAKKEVETETTAKKPTKGKKNAKK